MSRNNPSAICDLQALPVHMKITFFLFMFDFTLTSANLQISS